MQGLEAIEGMELLYRTLPPDLQHWHCFGKILSLTYGTRFDESRLEEIPVLSMLLTHQQGKYRIRLTLYNISGTVSFDVANGFFSGLTIDDLSNCGYEADSRFRVSSLEQDLDFKMYCARIRAELLP